MFTLVFVFSLLGLFFYAGYVFSRLSRNMSINRIVSKSAEARALMAKDPLRFHASIVYLMASLLKTTPQAKQFDKLEFIGRYIREVCPKEIWNDMLNVLEILTSNSVWEAPYGPEGKIVNKWAFVKGKEDWFYRLKEIYTYGYGFNSVEVAEEFGAILSKDDRRYLAYLLFRVANTDGKITGKGTASEENLLYKLCVKGLKMEEAEFDNLLVVFATGRVEEWYNQHLGEVKYPAYDQLADIYQRYNGTFFAADRIKTPRSSSLLAALLCGCAVSFGLILSAFSLEGNQMYRLVSKGVFLIPVLLFFVVLMKENLTNSTDLYSSGQLLRTRKDDSSKRKGIVWEVICAFGVVLFLYYGLTSLLLVAANRAFAKEYWIKRHVTSVYESQPEYYAFLNEKVTAEDFLSKGREDGQVNPVDAFGLMLLRKMSWQNLEKIKNSEQIGSVNIEEPDYDKLKAFLKLPAEDRVHYPIVLKFRIGYYGIICSVSCQIPEEVGNKCTSVGN